jgi:galactokinase
MTDRSVSLLIINTNIKHDLSCGGYSRQRSRCESAAKLFGVRALRDVTSAKLEKMKDNLDSSVFRCARNVVTEIERTLQTAKEIMNSNWPIVGQLMYASHRSLRYDYEVSCAELDVVVEIAGRIGIKKGIYGCRMTGGGFGGCAIALVKAEMTNVITGLIAANYKAKTGIEATIFSSRPAEGSKVLKT